MENNRLLVWLPEGASLETYDFPLNDHLVKTFGILATEITIVAKTYHTATNAIYFRSKRMQIAEAMKLSYIAAVLKISAIAPKWVGAIFIALEFWALITSSSQALANTLFMLGGILIYFAYERWQIYKNFLNTEMLY